MLTKQDQCVGLLPYIISKSYMPFFSPPCFLMEASVAGMLQKSEEYKKGKYKNFHLSENLAKENSKCVLLPCLTFVPGCFFIC